MRSPGAVGTPRRQRVGPIRLKNTRAKLNSRIRPASWGRDTHLYSMMCGSGLWMA